MTLLVMLWMLMLLAAGGTHSRTSPIGLESLLFPFAAIFYGSTGVNRISIYLLAIFCQFPIYGILTGAANFKGKIKPVLLTVVVIHLLAYLLATKLS